MPRYEIRIGDGNDGTYPSEHLWAASAVEAVESVVAQERAIQAQPGYQPLAEPDVLDGDDERAEAVWYEIDGMTALNGGAYYIIEAMRDDL